MKERNYRRVWVKGYYRKVSLLTYRNKVKEVRKWIKPHWRKIKIK